MSLCNTCNQNIECCECPIFNGNIDKIINNNFESRNSYNLHNIVDIVVDNIVLLIEHKIGNLSFQNHVYSSKHKKKKHHVHFSDIVNLIQNDLAIIAEYIIIKIKNKLDLGESSVNYIIDDYIGHLVEDFIMGLEFVSKNKNIRSKNPYDNNSDIEVILIDVEEKINHLNNSVVSIGDVLGENFDRIINKIEDHIRNLINLMLGKNKDLKLKNPYGGNFIIKIEELIGDLDFDIKEEILEIENQIGKIFGKKNKKKNKNKNRELINPYNFILDVENLVDDIEFDIEEEINEIRNEFKKIFGKKRRKSRNLVDHSSLMDGEIQQIRELLSKNGSVGIEEELCIIEIQIRKILGKYN
jgi:hypothetical protein